MKCAVLTTGLTGKSPRFIFLSTFPSSQYSRPESCRSFPQWVSADYLLGPSSLSLPAATAPRSDTRTLLKAASSPAGLFQQAQYCLQNIHSISAVHTLLTHMRIQEGLTSPPLWPHLLPFFLAPSSLPPSLTWVPLNRPCPLTPLLPLYGVLIHPSLPEHSCSSVRTHLCCHPEKPPSPPPTLHPHCSPALLPLYSVHACLPSVIVNHWPASFMTRSSLRAGIHSFL